MRQATRSWYHQLRSILVALALILGAGAITLTLTTGPASADTLGNMLPPFDIGQTWNICQGYNGPVSHTGTSLYGLDLTGAGCDNSAAGRNVRAPIDGTVSYYQSSYGNLCINTAGGRSYTLTHIDSSITSGGVTAGQFVGTVAPAGTRNNNNLAHIHFQIWAAPNCYNSSVIPFDAADGARICGAPDLTASGPNGGNGIWSGTSFTGANCTSIVGPAIGSRLGVVSTASGQQDVFWKGSDSNLHEAFWNGTAWYNFNIGFGPMFSAPTAVIQPSTGYVDVFWQGPSNNLYQAVWTGTAWAGPWSLGFGTVNSQPSAAASGSQVDVYWKDSTNKLQEAVWTGSAWVGFNLGSYFWNMGSAPSAYALSTGENDVYWTDTAGNLVEAVWNGSAWVGFTIPVGLIGSAPGSTHESSSGFSDVFWKDGSNLKQAVWNGSAWVSFNIGMGTLATAPAATAWGSQTDVYWTDSAGNLDEAVWNGSAWVNFQIPGTGVIPSS